MIPLSVAFMDGTVKEFEVDAQVTGKEMRSIIANKIGLVDQFGFSLFCAVENNVSRMHVNLSTKFTDFLPSSHPLLTAMISGKHLSISVILVS